MLAAIVHVLADAAVSMLVIVGLLFGRFLGWTWMDPVAGLVGAIVIAAWSYGLVRDTSAVLLDMNPDQNMADRMRATIESAGDQLTDLHLWCNRFRCYPAKPRTWILPIASRPISRTIPLDDPSAACWSKHGKGSRCFYMTALHRSGSHSSPNERHVPGPSVQVPTTTIPWAPSTSN